MKKAIKAMIILPIFFIGAFLVYKSQQDIARFETKKWDNVYNENSIQLYYADLDDSRFEIIKKTYKVDEFMEGGSTEVDKILKVADVLNNIVQYNLAAKDTEAFNGYDILRLKGLDNQASLREMAVIMRDLLNSNGITARVGILRSEKDRFTKEKTYYVVEYWSAENNKWIMVDFLDKGYFMQNNIPLSGVEIINENFGNLEYVGRNKKDNYLKDKKSVFDTYTIMIDNTLDMEKSNTYITYFKDESKINLEYNSNYLPPTIYTETESLFLSSPVDKAVLTDKGAYIILMKADGDNDTFIIGAFQNSRVINNYFLSINDREYYRVNTYESMDLKAGINSISLSLDGKKEVARIEIKYNNIDKNKEKKEEEK